MGKGALSRIQDCKANLISQQDGYLSSNWMTLNMTYVTQDPDTPARLLTQNQGPINYNSGPPPVSCHN